MPVSVDWPTSVITIPLADLTLISGNRYSYNVLDDLHFELRTLEASEEGGVYLKTHDHLADVTLAGVVYADVVEILAPYTIVFEDGQRQVVLTGANHNVSDVQVVNQVGLITGNSAGLTVPTGVAARASVITDGTTTGTVFILAWLERNSRPVQSGLVSATVRLIQPDGTEVFPAAALTGPNADGVFRLSIPAITLSTATNYYAEIVIVDSGGSVTSIQAHPTIV